MNNQQIYLKLIKNAIFLGYFHKNQLNKNKSKTSPFNFLNKTFLPTFHVGHVQILPMTLSWRMQFYAATNNAKIYQKMCSVNRWPTSFVNFKIGNVFFSGIWLNLWRRRLLLENGMTIFICFRHKWGNIQGNNRPCSFYNNLKLSRK